MDEFVVKRSEIADKRNRRIVDFPMSSQWLDNLRYI